MTTAQEAATAGGGHLGLTATGGGGFQQPHHMQQPVGGQGVIQVSEVVTMIIIIRCIIQSCTAVVNCSTSGKCTLLLLGHCVIDIVFEFIICILLSND